MIQFRKLLHEDYDDILDISKDIWDGTDYLPAVYHKWVDDKGIFLGGIDVEKEKVVAVGKLSVLSDGSGWLEGLRVHINYRGLKLGKRMTEEILSRAIKALEEGAINKVAFATHIGNVESINMMEKLNFKVVEAQVLAIKNISKVAPNLTKDSFVIEPWDISYEEFVNHTYMKRRNGLLPLAFVFEQVNNELFESLKANNCFVKINGHEGLFKYKGEPNFIAMEDNFEGLNTFMDYYLLSYKDKGVQEIYTPIYQEDKELIESLKAAGYISCADWETDYFYYVHAEDAERGHD